MAVAVRFAFQVASGVNVGEGDLPAVIDVVRDKVGPDYLNGMIVILAPGQPVAYIEDDLEFTVQQLLEGVPDLVAGRRFGIGFSEAPGRVDVKPVDGTIWVSADYFQPLAAPAAELLAAVVDCCERFIAFVRSAYPDHPGVQERIDQLDPWLGGARAALGGAGTP